MTEVQGYGLFLDGWLGEAAKEMTEEQRAEFARLVRAYNATQTGRDGKYEDWFEEDNEAWIAAFEQAVGHLDLAARWRAYSDASTARIAGAVIAVLAGMSEAEAARQAGISRTTLRKALGKG